MSEPHRLAPRVDAALSVALRQARLFTLVEPELPTQFQRVPAVESLGDETVLDPIETHPGNLDRASGRRDAEILALVRTGQHPPRQDLIPLGDQIDDLEVEIGERLPPLRLEPFAAGPEI